MHSFKIYKILGKTFIKFLFSSIYSSVIDVAFFAYFCSIFKNLNGISYIAFLTIAARIISCFYNYMINFKFVFSYEGKSKKASSAYFGLVIIQMIVSAMLVMGGAAKLPKVQEGVIKIIVDTVLFFFSYCIQREFIFNIREKNRREK